MGKKMARHADMACIFDETSSVQQMLKKRVTIREEKSKKYEKEKTLESNICGFGQLFCWQLPCLLQHLRQYRQKQQMCRQKQLMKMS